ncbi:MAG: hypothetical protein KIS96_14360 [Bauldia sp.]|nr:hypothetical protein [Bauldia sp.]
MKNELHNLLVARFVREIVGPAIKDGASDAQLMVLFESIQFGMMEVLQLHYQLAPAVAAFLIEESLHQATERLVSKRADDSVRPGK